MQQSPKILAMVSEIDEFKGAWQALGTLAPETLAALRRVATIESIGSSTRIEGSKLSDQEVERLLSNLEIKTFDTRDEQEVVGYSEVIHRLGPWKSADAVEWETLKWVDWFNNRRLLEPIGYITPTEAEEALYANMNTLDKVA